MEKNKIEEIFNSYNTRLTIINDNIKGLLNDINNFKLIYDTPDEKDKLFKLIDLIKNNNNNNNNIISDEIQIKFDNINVTNDTINNIVNTDSKDFNIINLNIKSVCENKLSDTDKTIIQGDLFASSDNSNDVDLEQQASLS